MHSCLCVIALFGQGSASGCCLLGLWCPYPARVYRGNHGYSSHHHYLHYLQSFSCSAGSGVLNTPRARKLKTIIGKHLWWTLDIHSINQPLKLLGSPSITSQPKYCSLVMFDVVQALLILRSYQQILPSIGTVYDPEVSKCLFQALHSCYLYWISHNLSPSEHKTQLGRIWKSKLSETVHFMLTWWASAEFRKDSQNT